MARRYLLTLITLVCAYNVVYAGVTGTITGTVVDKNDKKPLSGATIRVEGTTRGAISKADGSFIITKVNAGTYTVKVTYASYDTVVAVIKLSADETYRQNFALVPNLGTTSKTIYVEAPDRSIRSENIGRVVAIDGKEMNKMGKNSVAEMISTQAGVQASGNGFTIRGGRAEETQVLVDGMSVSDNFTGGLGNVGSTISSSMVSPLGVEQVQVATGNASAEYGGATAGTVNSVVKTGKTTAYEGIVQWRKDVPFLFGKAKNGTELMAPLSDVVDASFGGPLGFSESTFFIVVRNSFENFRNFGIGVLDPVGNNLGQLPNNRSWGRNITGRLKFQITDNDFLLVGGTYGVGAYERSSWGWLYADGTGVATGQDGNPILDANGNVQSNGVAERIAKQAAIQEFTTNAFAQLSHNSNDGISFDVRASYNSKTTEIGKRKDYGAPGIFTGWELYLPEDNISIGDTAYEQGANAILDAYDYLRLPIFSEDGFSRVEVTKRNPITGYVEGPSDAQTTANPYGLFSYFPYTGNEAGVDFRSSRFWQADGNLSYNLQSGETTHRLKAGFEFRQFRLTRHQNSNPWDGSPFYDVYGSDYGGNLYFDVKPNDPNALAAKLASEEPYNPITAGLYVQDQIQFKGLVFTPSFRLDYLNADAQYRTNYDRFYPFGDTVGFANTTAKMYISPRITITYPLSKPDDDLARLIRMSYGIYYQAAPFAEFYDAFNSFLLRGSQVLGNPNLEMQRTNQYEVTFEQQLSKTLNFTATGFYKDIYNQPGTAYVRVLPNPFFQTVLSDYGSVRGIEFTLAKRTTDNWGFNVNYALQFVRGTSNAAGTVFAIDPITNEPAFPVNDFYLSNDRRHRVNVVANLEFGKDEGPSIAGVAFLQYFSLNVTGFWQSGAPYTPVDGRGQATGEVNSARFPSVWNTDLRLVRRIPLEGLLNGNTSIEVFLDATNLLNFVDAASFFTRTGSPDYDGLALNRVIGDFPSTTYFKDANPTNLATIAPSQYDRAGRRLYNEAVDFNSDGRVSPEETFQGYKNYVATVVARSGNYYLPRTVYFGVRFNF